MVHGQIPLKEPMPSDPVGSSARPGIAAAAFISEVLDLGDRVQS